MGEVKDCDLPVSDLTGFWLAAVRLVRLADEHLDHESLLEATVAASLTFHCNSATGGPDYQ